MTLNPLDALNLEKERVVFVFYGWKHSDGSVGSNYFKLAHSFAEAYEDLIENPAVQPAKVLYIVNDIFVETDENGTPTLHIELRDLGDALDQ